MNDDTIHVKFTEEETAFRLENNVLVINGRRIELTDEMLGDIIGSDWLLKKIKEMKNPAG